MARGGISSAGIGAQFKTYKAGDGIKNLVAAANRNAAVGLAVVRSANDTVDLGTDGDTIFGFIEVYEDDGHAGVQFRGFREGVIVSGESTDTATLNKVVATNGKGEVKDSSTTTKMTIPTFDSVDSTDGTATVFLG